MNYYPFHLGDYMAHTAHLDPLEDLAYRRMLDLYYLRECALPASVDDIAKLIRMRKNLDEIRNVLREFFVQEETGDWVQMRCEQEIERMQDKQTKARLSAAASVRARSANARKPKSERSTDAERTLNERSTDVELPTPTPTPEERAEPLALADVPPSDPPRPPMSPDEIIFGYGVPLLVNAGTADKQARSFLGKLRKAHGDDTVVNTLRQCIRAKPLQPLEWMAKALPPAVQAAPEEVERKRRQAENDKALAMLNGHNDAEVFDGTARVL